MYKVQAKYNREVGDEGEMKTVTENYLVDAVSVTDSEVKFTEWCPDNYQNMRILGSSESDVAEVVFSDDFDEADDDIHFYRVSIGDPTETKKGIKYKYFYVVVNGKDLNNALSNVISFYTKDSTIDYDFKSIVRIKDIIDTDLVKSIEL